MTVQTRLSAKGQVVIPKDVRDRLGWKAGDSLTIEMAPNGFLLMKTERRGKVPVAEGLARLRQLRIYSGPPISDNDMKAAVRRKAQEQAR